MLKNKKSVFMLMLFTIFFFSLPGLFASDLIIPSAGTVVVEFIGSNAAFINDVSVITPVNRFLFNTANTRIGATVSLDAHAAGTSFEFQLIANTGSGTYTWSSNPANNSDGEDHVRTITIDSETYRLEWEDLPGLGDADYNDAVMVVHLGGDTDGDGLWDLWETNGVDSNYDGTIDLPIHQAPYNADPDHKDIFVEIDWMQNADHSHEPKQDAIDLVVDAFDNAPVPNPDGIDGITLHVDVSNSITHEEFCRFDPPAGSGHASFDAIKTNNFNDARRSVYHYCLFVHRLGLTNSAGVIRNYSGLAELPGNDFIVSLGHWHSGAGDIDGDGLNDGDVGTIMEQAGTLMHELGHNLDLGHGGHNGVNYKPNYISIMNYFFQMSGILPAGVMDYSDEVLPDLDEEHLDENVGIQDGTDNTMFYDPNGVERTVAGNGAINWNWANGIENDVEVNINGDEDDTTIPPTPILGVLEGSDDWERILYDFTSTWDFEDGVHDFIDEEIMDDVLSIKLRAPVADAGGPYSGDEGSVIFFDAAASRDPNGDDLTYRWDFESDGIWDTEWSVNSTANNTWYDDFNGEATVEVSDGLFSSQAQADVVVNNVAPAADAGPDQEVFSGEEVLFSGSFTDPGTLDTHTVSWDFGDSTSTTGTLTPSHTYLIAGDYTVTLTVTDDDGGSDQDMLIVTVKRIPIEIDIKPGSDENPVNISSNGLLPVAILGGGDIDPALVNVTTIELNPGYASALKNNLEDVDDDGDVDLILHFKTIETGIVLGDSTATLYADLLDGRQVEGIDVVRPLDNNGKKK